MTRAWNQFKLLLWKNFLLQKRRVVVTFFQLAIPTLFAIVLLVVRHKVRAEKVTTPTTWEPFSVERLQPLFCPIYGACLLDNWRVYYSPHNEVTERVMESARRSMGFTFLSHIKEVIGFPTEEALVNEFMLKFNNASTGILTSKCDILGGIVFTNIARNATKLPSTIEYKIRMPYTPRTSNMDFKVDPMKAESNWRTILMFPQYPEVGPRNKGTQFGNDPGYVQEGFLTLQKHVDQAIIKELSPDTNTSRIPLQLRRFPYPPYNDDPFILVIQSQMPFIIMLSFIFTALYIVKDVVHEKERRLKESMKMMGLSSWLHWTAWFIKYLMFLLVSVSIMTVLFTVSTGENGSIVGYTSWSVLLVFLLLYAIATINFCFAVSVFFSGANSAAAAGGVVYFLTYVPYVFLQQRYGSLSLATKLSTALLPNVAMAYGAQVTGMFEGSGAGVQWSTLGQGSSVDDSFTMLWVFIMLIFDAVLYVLVACYVETVWPGEFGVPQPWYFPVMRSYWCGNVPKDHDPERTHLLSPSHHSEFIEEAQLGLRAGISINQLNKVYTTGGRKVTAVDGMTLNMYEGQITALLGHNGAGKTTTMSMLTGVFPPTGGSALVNGHDIRTDIAGVRQSLGLCPQHNVLFDTLTVSEHLEFFAKLKGCEADQMKQERRQMLITLGLTDKSDALTKTLSGGMKRKLCVGIALIGGSKVLILDEPTSGMDPDARRHTWDILQRHRAGRTILLSTHIMHEADILGDRIAIMADGVIQCCGTPPFLKKKYGAGYHMVMVKEQGCDADTVTSVVQKHVPDARVESDVSLELSFILPHESKAQFAALFDEIENRRSELKIASYGASVTTMEEVFLNVGKQRNSPSNSNGNNNQKYDRVHKGYGSIERPKGLISDVRKRPSCKNTGIRLCTQQIRAMFGKRMLHTYRNWLVTSAQMFVPVLFTIIVLIVLQTLPKPQDSPPLTLNMSRFGDNTVLYSDDKISSQENTKLGDIFSRQFQADHVTTTEELHLKNQNMLEYLLSLGKSDIIEFNKRYMIAAEIQTKKTLAYFNAQAYHTAAMALNAIDNTLLRYSTNASYSIKTTNHPFPRTIGNKLNEMATKGYDGYTIAINVMFGMAFLTSSLVLFLIRERTVKAKHCQFMSGVGTWTFWVTTFTWDFLNFIIPCVFIVVAFIGFDVHAYADDQRYWDVLLLFVLYGWAVLPFMYLLSLLFTVPASGFVWLSMFNIVSGVATVLSVDILALPGLGTANISKVLEWIFLPVLPHYCLGQGLSDFFFNNKFLGICTNSLVKTGCMFGLVNPCCKGNCGEQCVDYTEDYLSWQPGGIGRHLVFLAVQGLAYFSILFLIESQALQRLWYFCRPRMQDSAVFVDSDSLLEDDSGVSSLVQDDVHDSCSLSDHSIQICDDVSGYDAVTSTSIEDSDVAAERQRIVGGDFGTLLQSETLILRELSKYYGDQMAVDRLSLGIQPGECFGLLGINGAGKTSTFKMLTGDETVSGGDAFLNGFSVKNVHQIRKQVGYCPQFDALINELTGRETLTMYARLRGVPESDLSHSVDNMLQCLLLEQYADRLVKTYSGGTKRKLSTAIALIGDPPIVFLDEPSTGMDPVARRSLWHVLSGLKDKGRTLVLTSHSMEECEALCTKLAIMVNGEIKCLGSPQHLKNKFGEGFTIMAKVAPSAGEMREPDTRPLIQHIVEQFPGSVVKDVHQGMVHIHVSDTRITWAKLFGTMESAKKTHSVEEYSVSQTTLEQVFMNLARSQVAPRESRLSCCRSCSILCTRCSCGADNNHKHTSQGRI